MKKNYLLLFLFFPLFAMISCKKGSGEGGSSSIKGKVYCWSYNTNFTMVVDSGYVAHEEVYIIYGDDPTYSDNQKTNYDGTYEFKYLRKGKYRLFAYSTDSSRSLYSKIADKAIIRDVEITQNKQEVPVSDMVIIKNN